MEFRGKFPKLKFSRPLRKIGKVIPQLKQLYSHRILWLLSTWTLHNETANLIFKVIPIAGLRGLNYYFVSRSQEISDTIQFLSFYYQIIVFSNYSAVSVRLLYGIELWVWLEINKRLVITRFSLKCDRLDISRKSPMLKQAAKCD